VGHHPPGAADGVDRRGHRRAGTSDLHGYAEMLIDGREAKVADIEAVSADVTGGRI
jgi:hypothetical protein